MEIFSHLTHNSNYYNHNHTILSVDDEKDILNLFCDCLQKFGYETIPFNNPVEAFHNFRKNSHDLIILDLKMPKMGGMTLYHIIKEIDNNVII
jgi:DNA-binding response OmpR family regulator